MPRLLFLLVTFCLASACSSVWQGTADTMKAAFKGQPAALPVSRVEVSLRPYFQILAQTPETEAILVLTRVAGPTLYWQTGTQESLVFTHGLIQRTTGLVDSHSGLANNLEQTRFIGFNPFATGLHTITSNTKALREIDLGNYRYGIQVSSVFHKYSPEAVTILDETRQLWRIDEAISAPAIGLFATNHFWVDDTGFIWKSTQTLWPGFAITVTQLRPYRDDAS